MGEYEMTPRQMRYELLTLLVATKPSNTKASTVVKIMNEYYDAIIEKDGQVVEFCLYEGEV